MRRVDVSGFWPMKAGNEPRRHEGAGPRCPSGCRPLPFDDVLVQVEYRGKGPHEAARGGRRLLGARPDLDNLDRLGLTHLIETVVTARGIARKPAPDVYLAALARLQVDPCAVVAIEDSPHGIAAAKTAGLRVVAVPNLVTTHLDLAGADRLVRYPANVVLDLAVDLAAHR
ncbi:HAD-IA family hydrolase [Nonomuraea sp. K274]|uniref:HAD-IA family hydrolase n=1 Tax=Nonomuraea cypriaca TaxID=1187855 RepID=A0A931EXE5_9ACTN|nr:HAD-IA family hydrolase [Nonomuraea cypriaca]